MVAYDHSEVEKWRHSARWKRRVRQHLQMHPLCVMCEAQNQIVAAEVVDHRVPHRGDYKLFWFGELDGLCKPHHDRSKQQQEVRGFSSEIGPDGIPTDRAHPFHRLAGG